MKSIELFNGSVASNAITIDILEEWLRDSIWDQIGFLPFEVVNYFDLELGDAMVFERSLRSLIHSAKHQWHSWGNEILAARESEKQREEWAKKMLEWEKCDQAETPSQEII